MDGLTPLSNVIVISATNRLDKIDSALLRPGRFDRHILVDLPSAEDREQILNVVLSQKPKSADFPIKKLAAETEGFSGAELNNLIQEAVLSTLKKDINAPVLDYSHVEESLHMLRGKKDRNKSTLNSNSKIDELSRLVGKL